MTCLRSWLSSAKMIVAVRARRSLRFNMLSKSCVHLHSDLLTNTSVKRRERRAPVELALMLVCAAMTSAGAATIKELYAFPAGTNDPNGLVLASDGLFYGTTANGGAAGFGTIFRM